MAYGGAERTGGKGGFGSGVKISMEFKSYVNSKWGNQFEALGARQQEVLSAIGGGTEEAALLLKYLYISMPLSDAGDYPVELFRETVRHGLFLQMCIRDRCSPGQTGERHRTS